MNESKSFLRRTGESMVITAVSIFTAAIVGSSVGVMWTKAMNQDKAITDATAELINTQEVFSEEIERQKKQDELITKNLTEINERLANLEIRRGIMPEMEAQAELEVFSMEQMARPPVQETLKNYKK